MKMNKTQKLIKALVDTGSEELPCASRKYRKFKHPNSICFYFVGKSAGLKVGMTISNSISKSYLVDDIIKKVKIVDFYFKF